MSSNLHYHPLNGELTAKCPFFPKINITGSKSKTKQSISGGGDTFLLVASSAPNWTFILDDFWHFLPLDCPESFYSLFHHCRISQPFGGFSEVIIFASGLWPDIRWELSYLVTVSSSLLCRWNVSSFYLINSVLFALLGTLCFFNSYFQLYLPLDWHGACKNKQTA